MKETFRILSPRPSTIFLFGPRKYLSNRTSSTQKTPQVKKNLNLEKISHRFFAEYFLLKYFFSKQSYSRGASIGNSRQRARTNPANAPSIEQNHQEPESERTMQDLSTATASTHPFSIISVFCGGVPAVTHLLFVAAIRLIGVPAPSDGSSQAPMSPFTA